MVTIKYSFSQEDYQELERERRGGTLRRIVRVSFGSFSGFMGVYTIWQAVFLFPWNHPFRNLLIACMGLICLWGGLEFPGLALLLRCFSDPYGLRELRVEDASLTYLWDGSSRQFSWRPHRGFSENEKFFFLRASRDGAKWTVPKRAVTHEQELQLRDLVRRESAEN